MAEATGFWFDEFHTIQSADLAVVREWIDKHGIKRSTRLCSLNEFMAAQKVEDELDGDLMVYGNCYYKEVNGQRVRVAPKDVVYSGGGYYERDTETQVERKSK